MAITAIYDNSTITVNIVKEYLGLPVTPAESGDPPPYTAEDITLGFMLGAAKRAADNYCQNYFTDDNLPPESGDTVTIPDDVEMWILERVSRDYFRRHEGAKRISTYEVQDVTFGGDDLCKLDPYRMLFGV
jgi:hypothetical protein